MSLSSPCPFWKTKPNALFFRLVAVHERICRFKLTLRAVEVAPSDRAREKRCAKSSMRMSGSALVRLEMDLRALR